MSTTATPTAPVASANAPVTPAAPAEKLPNGPVEKKLYRTTVLVLPGMQSRSGGLDVSRCQQMASVLKNGGTLPKMRAYEIVDEKHKHHGKTLLVGGFHRNEGHNIAEIKEAVYDVWRGTFPDAVRAAARENVEHDTAGRYRSNDDKKKAVMMYCYSYANVPKTQLPSYRDIAKECGVSHEFVNQIDPFGRSESVTLKNDDGGIRDRSEAAKKKKKKKAKAKLELFDWKTYNDKLGYMARGLDTVAETHGVPKDSPEFKEALAHLEAITQAFKAWHDKFSNSGAVATAAKKADAQAAATPKGKAKAKAKAKKATKPKDDTPKDEMGFPKTYVDTPANGTPAVAATASGS